METASPLEPISAQSATDDVATLPHISSPAPARTPLRPALCSLGFLPSSFLIHFAIRYGFPSRLRLLSRRALLHRLRSSPGLGYVDQPPLIAVLARISEMLFGISPTGIRIFAFAASGITVGLSGLLARQFGGRQNAQILAMTAVLAVPVLLGTGNFLSMNAFEPVFFMGALLVLIRIADGSASPRAWLLFGLFAGIGVENKDTIVFFLIALLGGLLLSPQRRILASGWCAAGIALLLLLALPNFLWQWAHHFPTYQFLNAVAHTEKNTKLGPFAFLISS